MGERKETWRKIEDLRKNLYHLITQNENLVAKDVVKISQELDIVLNEYNRIAKEKIA